MALCLRSTRLYSPKESPPNAAGVTRDVLLKHASRACDGPRPDRHARRAKDLRGFNGPDHDDTKSAVTATAMP